MTVRCAPLRTPALECSSSEFWSAPNAYLVGRACRAGLTLYGVMWSPGPAQLLRILSTPLALLLQRGFCVSMCRVYSGPRPEGKRPHAFGGKAAARRTNPSRAVSSGEQRAVPLAHSGVAPQISRSLKSPDQTARWAFYAFTCGLDRRFQPAAES